MHPQLPVSYFSYTRSIAHQFTRLTEYSEYPFPEAFVTLLARLQELIIE